ncbi:alpha/beta-hydrolase [Wilcoxina mikolae CBS 423.85]|nr:alpha/beta-hydrolase [Wilcoxina mikolae CBS 423.85]
MPTTTLNNPSLGPRTGLLHNNTASYRGLKFATLFSPFAASSPETSLPGGDATNFGPEPLQNPGACGIEWFLIGASCPVEDGVQPKWSGTECLTLNITAPAKVPEKKKLPVLVFIHGGAYMHGASSWPQYSLVPLVSSSIDSSTPIIAVSINYRTNIFGFLEHPSLPANRGLNDQRLALDWIHRNISGFGGDPENITLLGQSAGGASVGVHIAVGIAGVKRAVMMSGDPGLRPAVPPEVHQATFSQVCSALSLDPETAIETLGSMPQKELYENLPSNILYLPSLPLPSGTGEAIEALMIGDTKDDGGIILPPTPISPTTVYEHFSSQLPASFTALYGLNTSDNPSSTREKLSQIFTDWAFYAPAVARARESSEEVPTYLYHFNAVNDWDSIWKGQSNHILDLAYLFGNYPELKQSTVGREMREAVVTFVNGGAPWEGFREGRGVKVFGEGSGEERERGEQVWKVAEEAGGWEKVRGVVMGVLEKL